ncbi:glutathione S-transferase C-terminal-like protein [Trichophaea hybrida]|nr:glutathione S-transferase C-terminal-like protein [Trichophaea hybrida]
MTTPQFSLYVHASGPNPWKVVIILEELKLPYKTITVSTTDDANHKPPYTLLNPNGRMPTLIDHSNNDFTIWESGAIILYLVEKYDTEKKLSFDSFESNALAKQYLMFQMSGQGPYFGQFAWFSLFHPEKVPSAIERYKNEVRRVLGVLNTILQGKKYLVEDRVSYADLAFLSWLWVMEFPALGVAGWKEEPQFEAVSRWYAMLEERESVKKTHELKDAANKK